MTRNGTAKVMKLPMSLARVKSSGDTGRLITKARVFSLRSVTSEVEIEKQAIETITMISISEPT